VGRFTSGPQEGFFLNTFSLGVYPELVRERERWSSRIGGWPAGVLAALRVVRADRHPLEARLRGEPRPLWLVFVGNGTYHRMGLTPGRRLDLADGRLDVRVVHGGRLHLAGIGPGTLLAYDGEVTEAAGEVTLEKLPQALTVYRPLPTG
jgi:undecaprenyl-diphosphatase